MSVSPRNRANCVDETWEKGHIAKAGLGTGDIFFVFLENPWEKAGKRKRAQKRAARVFARGARGRNPGPKSAFFLVFSFQNLAQNWIPLGQGNQVEPGKFYVFAFFFYFGISIFSAG